MNFEHEGRVYEMKVEPFKVAQIQYRAVGVCGADRVVIPGTSSDSPSIAEGLSIMVISQLRRPRIERGATCVE